MKLSHYLILIILLIPILAFLLFPTFTKPIFEEADLLITFCSYILSVALLFYNINLKFHFAINKFLLWFRQDHTIWRFSYFLEGEDINMDTFLNELKSKNIKVNKNTGDFLELIYQESHLFKVQIKKGENLSLNLFSNKIIVPTKRRNSTMNELIEVAECLESSVRSLVHKSRKYDLTIEYPRSSPFYNYWIKSLPEQSIYNFNFSIRVPSNQNSVKVNKNEIMISSNSLNKLFDTTKNYLSLQIEI